MAPGPELTAAEISRYARHLILPGVGVAGQRRLRAARVLVLGAGGLGSPVLMYLAAAGVGTLGIVDDDVVEESNLQRQIAHGVADVGRPKVDSAADAIAALGGGVRVERHAARFDASNAVDLVSRYDLVIDGTDNFATRYLAADAAEATSTPLVWGSIFRFTGQVAVWWSGPGAPGGRGIGLRDVYPEPPPVGAVPSCAEGGVLGVLCGSVGSLMATEAIKLITGLGEGLYGRLAVYDALGPAQRVVRLAAEPGRRLVTDVVAEVTDAAACGLPGAEAADGVEAADDGSIGPVELRRRLDAGEPLVLIDVREQLEWDIVRLPGAVHVPVSRIAAGDALERLPAGRPVLYCKSGARSAVAVQRVRSAGRADAVHLRGGLLAWADEVDPTLPRY